MDIRSLHLPFRVGTTSYIIPDDLLANAQFLAPIVQDMQLVLFDLKDGPSNLPDAPTIAALARLGAERDFTYTVHLLDDLQNGDEDSPSSALSRARQVIELTRPLHPWAWVGHLEGRAVRTAAPAARLAIWQAQAVAAVTRVAGWADTPAQIAIENLEGYPPDFVDPVVTATHAGRCVDVGHLWLDGHDPVPHLLAALPRLRVVHLHGVAERDHVSLAHAPAAQLDAVIRTLLEVQFGGVVTLEVFEEEDFLSSLNAFAAGVSHMS